MPSWAWVSTTYFAEGLPYMIVRWLSGVYFTEIGLREAVIGYTNWLGAPWNLKFLWAPLVDWAGSKRRWMLAVQLALAVAFGLLALFVRAGPAGGVKGVKLEWSQLATTFDPVTGWSHQTAILGVIGMLIVTAFLSSTNDVAIDAYYIEGLPERTAQAQYSGLRVTWYRVAVLFAKFALIAFPTWFGGFLCGAAVMAALALFHVFAAPRFPSDVVRSRLNRKPFLTHLWESIRSYLAQDRMWIVVPFIILYKMGDEVLFALNTTFLMRELNVTKPQLSLLSGAVGTTTAIAGTMLGAFWIKRVGLKRAIWPLTLAMNLFIWAYVWLAMARPDAQTTGGMAMIAVVHGYEQLAVGLGNAALTVFLLYTCRPEYKAAHYAFGSAIMSLTGTILGGFAGTVVERYGYVVLYVASFALSIPAMILLFFVPIRDDVGKA
jgi:PAT family beta-lactamase induction signal transducer AmpG